LAPPLIGSPIELKSGERAYVMEFIPTKQIGVTPEQLASEPQHLAFFEKVRSLGFRITGPALSIDYSGRLWITNPLYVDYTP